VFIRRGEQKAGNVTFLLLPLHLEGLFTQMVEGAAQSHLNDIPVPELN